MGHVPVGLCSGEDRSTALEFMSGIVEGWGKEVGVGAQGQGEAESMGVGQRRHLNGGYSWKNPVTWRLGMRRAGSSRKNPGWGQAKCICADNLKFCRWELQKRRCREEGVQGEVGLETPLGPQVKI